MPALNRKSCLLFIVEYLARLFWNASFCERWGHSWLIVRTNAAALAKYPKNREKSRIVRILAIHVRTTCNLAASVKL
jgi:hypothetical protein